jgi:hypothetical protein
MEQNRMPDRKLSPEAAAELGIPPQYRYESLIARVVAGNGTWVRVELDELQGASIPAKHSCLLQAARRRGLQFSCTFRCVGVCFARQLLQDELTTSVPL